MVANQVRDRVARGGHALGTFAYSPDEALVEIAGAAGLDFVVVDTEHSALDARDVRRLAGAARRSGLTPFVRLGEPTPHSIGRALDMGALGVVLPHLSEPARARELVAAARFPPRGRRSACTCTPATAYGLADLGAHARAIDAEVWVIGMIEDPAGVERIEELLAVPGLDAVLPGPSDLAASYGVPGRLDHPQVVAAVERVAAAARERGTEPAAYVRSAAEARTWADRGVRIFVRSIDYRLVARAYADAVGELRAALPEPVPAEGMP